MLSATAKHTANTRREATDIVHEIISDSVNDVFHFSVYFDEISGKWIVMETEWVPDNK